MLTFLCLCGICSVVRGCPLALYTKPNLFSLTGKVVKLPAPVWSYRFVNMNFNIFLVTFHDHLNLKVKCDLITVPNLSGLRHGKKMSLSLLHI